MESTIQVLIISHAVLGGIALLSGAIALAVKKGSVPHKKAGKVFYYSMLASALFAFIVSCMPGHESPFLFAIGLFSVYFLLSGYRSLRFKKRGINLKWDRIISIGVLITGLAMVLYPLITKGVFNLVLGTFGIASIYFGIRDFMLYRKPEKVKAEWLNLHVGKMTGGYIAAVSAFFVVNRILPGIWNWFAPSIIGTIYIIYWLRKLNKKKSAK